MKRLEVFCYGLTLVFGCIIGYLNLHNNEVQPAVLAILVFTALLSFLQPRRAWLWAILLGLSVMLSYFIAEAIGYHAPPPDPNIFATLIALIPACIGATLGAVLRRLTIHVNNQAT